VKINCLSCGHNVELDEAYGDHYEGLIRCYGCGAMLEILTEQGAIRYVRFVSASLNESEGPPSVKQRRSESEAEHGASPNNRIA